MELLEVKLKKSEFDTIECWLFLYSINILELYSGIQLIYSEMI